MAQGKVKWYNSTKGFGFIAKTDGKDIFVHRTGLNQSIHSLEPDQEVTFEEQDSPKGAVAVNVNLV